MRKSNGRGGAVLLAVALLSGAVGCAGMSKSECVSADWRMIGFEDGSQGAGLGRLTRYRSDCADYGVVPDLDAYNDGRYSGLNEFCRPEHGYRLGASGHAYTGVCPAQLESEFLERYRDGQRVHVASARVRDAERDLRNHQQKLDELEAQEKAAKLELLEEGLTPLRRAQILTEILESVKTREAMEQERPALEERVEELDLELRRVRDETDSAADY